MTKAELIKEISRKTGIERTQVEVVTEAFMHCIKECVSNKQSVVLRGFGIFMAKKRAAKIARNITKGTAMALPAHFIPAFKPYKKFSQKVKARLS
jgi:DNA-binding protein HU-beta